ncbi:DEAD/DEAH box helicase [Micromonospora sonneratiae]|uniref:DEAD/DEAH box helicase n=1 Tax=Micromonospora sonneratiae TaxID=1184706 RepID=A0ABW3YQ46_9ACTN
MEPEWQARFDKVWLWADWPGRAGRPDTGIDLVAQLRDGGGLAAIQCKFYDSGRQVAKADIDGFLATSARTEFTERYIVDTSAGWSKNAAEVLAGQAIPVQRLDVGYLNEARIDWSQFTWSKPEALTSTAPKQLLPHQEVALKKVCDGLSEHDRGKLIMACGTGKTFTGLNIALTLVPAGGSVLFLVPSIQLLSQTLREWMNEAGTKLRPFAVCSDVRVGRSRGGEDADMAVNELQEPATTSSAALAARFNAPHGDGRRSVVFATYQSIDVVAQAQHMGIPRFDLVVCDEAHRTTGVTLSGADESAFVRVHDGDYLKAAKRLYMTATPRVFGDEARRKAADADAVMADMNDEEIFGPELHRLGFGEAVEAGLLTDYRVQVLAVDEAYVARYFQQALAKSGEISLPDAAKLIGCWRGLSKDYGPATTTPNGGGSDGEDAAPMRTAVAFAKDIKDSKRAADALPFFVDEAIDDGGVVREGAHPIKVEARHVDGTMGIHQRNAHLAWLKENIGSDDAVCRVLTNARCLSEGVDVPALDAVMFLTPRGSQVDVVQAVGRVMRRAVGKKLGYIILPVVVPTGVTPEQALANNERYRVVWQVLQALRSHDERFQALVNSIELNKTRPDRLQIFGVTAPKPESANDVHTAAGQRTTSGDADAGNQVPTAAPGERFEQMLAEFPLEAFRDAMYARIVTKVGERRYWETWAKDVADIAHNHIERINGLLATPGSQTAAEFDRFLTGLRGNLNDSISQADAVEMLAQHLVTRPVFDALFAGYDFTGHNPVAQAMERMLAALDEHALETENDRLKRFYASVRRRVEGVSDVEGKQKIMVELYDKFFATAFKRTVDKLGIVYTPVEIVDFILRSADDISRQEFGQGLTDEGVHILDGFTGTGTFLTRLLQTGLVKTHDLARKYTSELHGNEILLLAYYIAAVNIETTYAAITGQPAPFPGLILTDTFQSWEDDDIPDLKIFPENNQRLEILKKLPITVIVGNPPYSVGQGSGNDNNANESYPSLDRAIESTYAARSRATSKRTLYDSYIRAIKWASLRIKDRGIIAYITNGGFLDSNSADGMRRSLAEEFSSIHIYNLRGNRREGGAEGRPIFEAYNKGTGGSIATIAIVILVKNPHQSEPCVIRYAEVSDHTTARQKVDELVAARSITGLRSVPVNPNGHGDWLNQRRDDFHQFIAVGDKDGGAAIFSTFSLGLATGRDVWAYDFSRTQLSEKISRLANHFNSQVEAVECDPDHQVDRNPMRVSWNRNLDQYLARRRRIALQPDVAVRHGQYRPFTRQFVYFDQDVNAMRYQLPRLFPTATTGNTGFTLTGPSSHYDFCTIAANRLPDLHLLDTGQFFPRWRFEQVETGDGFDFAALGADVREVVDGYRRVDNITDGALRRFRAAYGDEIGKDDIFHYVYGLLHSPDYRTTYAADLKKSLPRIPLVTDPHPYIFTGMELMRLHLGYEQEEPYPLDGLDAGPPSGADPYDFYRVEKLSFAKRRVDGKLVPDRSTVIYNRHISVSGIPADAYEYQLGARSPIEWILDRYQVKADKASGITNDPNDWSREVGDPRYILDLLARVVTVSLQTVELIRAIPPLRIRPS